MEQKERDKSLAIQEPKELIVLEVIQEEIKRVEQQVMQGEQRFNRISFARLATFLLFALGILILFATKMLWSILLIAAGGGGFLFLLVQHNSLSDELEFRKRKIEVLKRWSSRKEGTWDTFLEWGTEYLEEKDYVAKDLDLFGEHSLYQMICTAHSNEGKRRLAEVLQQAEQGKVVCDEVRRRQQAVEELKEHWNFCVDFEAYALEQEEKQPQPKVNVETTADENHSSWITVCYLAAWIWPVALLISGVGAAFKWWSSGILLILYFAGLFLSFMLTGYLLPYMERVFGQREHIRARLKLMEVLEKETFESALLCKLRASVDSQNKKNAKSGIQSLERLLAAYNIRHNPIVHWLLSGVCLYDVHLTKAAIRWKETYGAGIEEGMQALTELEMLNSLSVLAQLYDGCYAELLERKQEPYINMKQGYHPLIASKEAVANSISLDASPRIITGSNMSGKTTFLRTIGLNVVLAYAGAPVCAHEMQLTILRPYTSMRITDDVNHGISTFYAEILRIKEMVEYGTSGAPMLCLIDEIFKGTNSADRIVGAEAVIRRLTQPHIIAIISTHDFELCKLAQNYHFEEYYNEEGIQFDYILRDGICKTTNALHLLKLAGLS